jgi:peptide/nickel transport system ATP-binding protein
MNSVNTSQSLISVNALNINFYTARGIAHVVKNVNFSIEFGETFGLVGESGCGKSVVSRSLMGLIPHPGKIDSGSILLTPTLGKQSIDIVKCTDQALQMIRGQTIGMIFQEPDMALNPIMRVGDQIAETYHIQAHLKGIQTFFSRWLPGYNRPKKEKYLSNAIELLKVLGISRPEIVAQQYPHQLSGGMKQRILIAIALAGSPSLLISDEATSSLDVSIQSQIIVLLDQLKKEKRIQSILFITHDLGLAAMFCDRLAVMYAGSMCEIGCVPKIFNQPKHPYTQALLEAIPKKSKSTKLKPIPGHVPDLVDAPTGCRFHPRCSQKMEKCEREIPSMHFVGKDHQVACWLKAADKNL